MAEKRSQKPLCQKCIELEAKDLSAETFMARIVEVKRERELHASQHQLLDLAESHDAKARTMRNLAASRPD